MKYLRIFLLALSAEFASRLNIFGWFIVALIPTSISIFVWLSILGQSKSLGGFTHGDFILYYLFMLIGFYLIGGHFAMNVATIIKSGSIANNLLKPFDVVLEKCLEEQAWKVLSFALSLPVATLIWFLFRDQINLNINFWQFLYFLVSIILGGLNFALLEAILGISAFWVIEIWPIREINNIFQMLFGGMMVPLTLMPQYLHSIANILPFKYMFYIPVTILIQKDIDPFGVIFQAIYIVVLFLLYRLLYTFGIQKFEAIGS